MRDPAPFVSVIRQQYPELVIERAHLNQQGQYHDVLVVNGKLIFRFAKFAAGIQTLRREAALLRTIQGQTTLPIPNPTYQHLDNATAGEAFVGYHLLPGQPLWLESFRAIQDQSVLVRMAHQLAGFLRELHTIALTRLRGLELPQADQVAEWQALYERIRRHLFPYMRLTAQQQVADHFEAYFATPNPFIPVLRHGDFGTGNLLYDPQSHNISGVIDFSECTLGDPAIDFAGLLSFGEDFCARCYEVYPELEKMMPRVHFYRGTFALQEALYGIETGDIIAFQNGIEEYR